MTDPNVTGDGQTVTIRIRISIRKRGGRKLVLAPDGTLAGPGLVVVQTHFFESDRHGEPKICPEFRSGQPRWDQARLTRADLDSRRTFALTRVR
jgi:hypothetical protein